ncbi:hypothetical protein QNH14_01300 [Apirhabdus apintestini]|nr:hypothetical protein QNH14_01300 [Enterobacteriaceae bacterium CA-0114]
MLIVGARAEAKFDVNWTWQSSFESEQYRHTLLNDTSDGSIQSLDSLVTATAEWNSVTGTFALESNNLLTTDRQSSVAKKLIVQELFWQPEAELAGVPLDLSIGKQRLDWDVGYGFRPWIFLSRTSATRWGYRLTKVLARSRHPGLMASVNGNWWQPMSPGPQPIRIRPG